MSDSVICVPPSSSASVCASSSLRRSDTLVDVGAVFVVGERDQVAVTGAVRDDADLAAVVGDEGVQHPDPGELDPSNVNHVPSPELARGQYFHRYRRRREGGSDPSPAQSQPRAGVALDLGAAAVGAPTSTMSGASSRMRSADSSSGCSWLARSAATRLR